jgi:hypothetical protein
MSFDLVVVGGTGQWMLLELCMRQQRLKKQAPFPENLWLIDRDLGPVNQEPSDNRDVVSDHLARVLARELEAADARLEAHNRYLLSRIACQPAMGDATHLQAMLSVPEERDITWTATTQQERNTDVRQGFFALPRLSAIWTSIQGFRGQQEVVLDRLPTFLDAAYLTPTGPAPRPLLVIGSLAGGTGAGLLPYLYQRLRDTPAQTWRRPVVIVAVLPWFTPPVQAGGQFQTVTWERCCRNASAGIKALYRITRDLRHRALEAGRNELPADLPPTTCVLAGPPIGLAAATSVAKLQPLDAVERGFIAPTIQILADALPDLIDTGRTQDQRQRFSFGTLQTHFLRKKTGADRQAAQDLVPLHSAGSYRAALQAQAIAGIDFEHAAHLSRNGLLGNIQQVSGLGRSVGGMVLSAALARRDQVQRFLESFTGRLRQRAGELSEAFNLEVSPSAASNLPMIFRELDELLADSRVQLWTEGDVKDGKADIRGLSAANLVFEALLKVNDVQEPSYRTFRSEGYDIEVRRFLPLNPEQADKNASRTSFHALPGALDGAGEVEELAELYAKEGKLGIEECDSKSYATFLGTAHVAADLTRTLKPGHPPDANHPLRKAIPLWRGFLHGLLETEEAGATRYSQILLTEGTLDSTRTFGDRIEQVIFSRQIAERRVRVALGVVSAELGFVPHTDLMETSSPPAELANAFTELERRLAQIELEVTRDYQLLAAFARHYLPHSSPADLPPWFRLLTSLCSSYPQREEIELWLYSRAVPSRSLKLQLAARGLPDEVFLPLRLDRSGVARVLAAAGEDFIAANGPSIDFQPFSNGQSYPILRFGDAASGGRRILWLDHSAVARAASAVPLVASGAGDPALEWPQPPASSAGLTSPNGEPS